MSHVGNILGKSVHDACAHVFCLQCLKARGNAPPIPLTPLSIPMSPPLSSPLQQNLKANRMKSTSTTNARDRKVNGQKRNEGKQRRRVHCPQNKGFHDLFYDLFMLGVALSFIFH